MLLAEAWGVAQRCDAAGGRVPHFILESLPFLGKRKVQHLQEPEEVCMRAQFYDDIQRIVREAQKLPAGPAGWNNDDIER